MPILRLAYTTLFLIALLAVFESWSQVGGHLDLLPWYLKLVLVTGAAFSVVKVAAAAVGSERVWNWQTLRWAGILLVLLIGCGLASYYAYLNLEEDEEEQQQSVSECGKTVSGLSAGAAQFPHAAPCFYVVKSRLNNERSSVWCRCHLDRGSSAGIQRPQGGGASFESDS